MALFSILHASDLHIADAPNHLGLFDRRYEDMWSNPELISLQASHDPDALDALASLAYERREELDLALLTGDLAATGSRPDLLAARARLTSPSKLHTTKDGNPTLGFLGSRLKLMPGNHDRFRASPAFLPGGTEFDKLFAAHWSAGQSVQLLLDSQKNGARLAVIAADFTLAREDVFLLTDAVRHFGKGRVYDDRLQELERLTREALAGGAAVVWAVHFKPECSERLLALEDDDLLLQAAADLGVSAILCGHTHSSTPLSDIGGVWVAACGTTTQSFSAEGNFAHLLRLTVPRGGGRAALELYRYKYSALLGFTRYD